MGSYVPNTMDQRKAMLDVIGVSSVDALFSSMAAQVKCHMVGIIMTGMGRDGANGLLEMRRNGAYTIGQDKESSVVYGMPCVAYDIGAVGVQASCQNIAGVLLQHLKTGK